MKVEIVDSGHGAVLVGGWSPEINERFASYDLNEGAHYIYFLSNYILKGG